MRAFGRDLIRGGHYGQRSCEPHLKAEHIAAPTNAAYVKKALANSEPSTHGTSRPFAALQHSGRDWRVNSTDQRNTYLKPRTWSDGDEEVSLGWFYSSSE